MKHATLYVVATPIGNLRDISLRAIDVLKRVDVVAAEDTRVCKKLLASLGISARIISSHQHSERRSAAGIVKLLAEGKSVALTTDAGTPAISDPGSEVVAHAREHGFTVVPVPGASALTAALSIAGQPLHKILFCGFLPARAGERKAVLESLVDVPSALVLYEAPHRILSSIADLTDILGADRRLTLCRELTKLHEEVHCCALGDAMAWLQSKPQRLRGEFVLVIGAGRPDETAARRESERVLGLLMSELPLKKAVSLATEITGGRKNELYRRALELARD